MEAYKPGLNPNAAEFAPKAQPPEGRDPNALGPTYSLASMPREEALADILSTQKAILNESLQGTDQEQKKALSKLSGAFKDFEDIKEVNDILAYLDGMTRRPPESVKVSYVVEEVIKMLDKVPELKGGRRRGKKSRKPRKPRRMTRRRRGGVSVMQDMMNRRMVAVDAVMDKMHQEFLATEEGSVVKAAKDALDAWSKKNRGAGAVLQITFPEGVTPEEFYTIFKEQIETYNIDGHNKTDLDFFFTESKRINGDPGKMFVNNSDNFDGRANDYLEKLLYAMEHEKRGSGKKSSRHRSKRHIQRR